MKWIGISGSWKYDFPEIRKDIAREVNEILGNGNGIVSGGAPGVDYWATELAIERYPDGSRTKICIPTSLRTYIEQVGQTEPSDPDISDKTYLDLVRQLIKLDEVGALICDESELTANTESFHKRNGVVIDNSDSLLAFQVNKSGGVENTINYAKAKGLKIKVLSYGT